MKPRNVVLLAAVFLAGCAQPYATKFSETQFVNARPSHQTRVGRYAVWDTFCGSLTFSGIVSKPPAHGTVVERPESWVVASRRTGSVDCTGKLVHGTAVYYTSEPGFQGTDQIGIWVQSANTGGMRDLIVVDVH